MSETKNLHFPHSCGIFLSEIYHNFVENVDLSVNWTHSLSIYIISNLSPIPLYSHKLIYYTRMYGMYYIVRTAGLLDLAWKYLEKAHTGRLAAQSPSVTLEDIDRMEVQIKSIFTTGFWSPNVGSKNTVPIFIVGMMRYCGPDSVHFITIYYYCFVLFLVCFIYLLLLIFYSIIFL